MPKVKPVFFDREIEVSDGEARVLKDAGLLRDDSGNAPAVVRVPTPPAPPVPPAGAGPTPAKGQ